MRRSCAALALLAAACGGNSSSPQPPPAPAGLTATPSAGQIALSWNASAGATGYDVERGTAAGAESKIASLTATAYADTAVAPATTYYYVVKATNSAGGTASAEVSATTPSAAPSVPANVHAAAGTAAGEIDIGWDAVAGATSYVVARSDAAGGAKAQIATPSTNSYADTGLGNGTTKYYVVRAVGPGGTSGDSAEASATTLNTPPAPTGLTVKPRTTHAMVQWTAVAAAASYTVLRATGAGSLSAVATTSSTQIDDSGLTASTSYTYAVSATNAVGSSANSATVTVTTAPPPPTALAAVGGNAKVSLSWTASAGATGYDVLSGTSSSGPFTSVGTPSGAGFTDSSVSNGSTVFYIVRATNSGVESDDAGPVSAAVHRELCVASSASNQVLVFNAEPGASPSPLRSFGSITGLAAPSGLAVADGHGEFLAANKPAGTLTVYGLSASGNGGPSRALGGGATTLQGPNELAYESELDELLVADGTQIKSFNRTDTTKAPKRTPLNLATSGGVVGVALSMLSHGNRMFVIDSHKIYVYKRDDTGSTAPTATIASTALDFLTDVAYDPRADIQASCPSSSLPCAGEVVVTTTTGGTQAVVAFPADSAGGTNVTPSRKIAGSSTGIFNPRSLAVDGSNLYVYDTLQAGVLVFAHNATGNVAPTGTAPLSGAATQLGSPTFRVRVDNTNSNLLVLNSSGRVLTFSKTSVSTGGNTAPARALSSASSGLDKPAGLRFDAAHGNLIVANQGQDGSLSTFAVSASGASTPTFQIAGPNNTNFSSGVVDVEIDSTHGELFVMPNGQPDVDVYGRTATGDVAPSRQLTDPAFSGGNSVTYDPTDDLIVTNDGSAIRGYARSFTNGTPQTAVRTISGSSTLLGVASQFGAGLFLDVLHQQLVSGYSVGGALFFARTANGNVAPSVLTPSTNLSTSFVAVDPPGGEVFLSNGFSVVVYPRSAIGGGATTPARTIGSAATGLYLAQGVAICN